MRTGIVILNYNDYSLTFNMIQKIKDFNEIDLIVIVDNCSIDNSYDKLKELENNKIKVLKTEKNMGYAAGNNYGLKYLMDKNIDYVIISNPDITFENQDIKRLKDDLENNDNIVLISPVISQNNHILRGWKLPKFKEEVLSNINYFSRYSNKLLEYDDAYYNKKLISVDVVSGCFFMIRYNEFKEIGFFDPNTFLYYEENILGKKMKNKGYLSYIDTTITIKHELSISVDKSFNSLKKYKILKESQRYYEKQYNHLNSLGIMILKITYYISYGISFIHLKIKGVIK